MKNNEKNGLFKFVNFDVNSAKNLVKEFKIKESMKYQSYECTIKTHIENGVIQSIINGIIESASRGCHTMSYRIPNTQYNSKYPIPKTLELISEHLSTYFKDLGFTCNIAHSCIFDSTTEDSCLRLKIYWND